MFESREKQIAGLTLRWLCDFLTGLCIRFGRTMYGYTTQCKHLI